MIIDINTFFQPARWVRLVDEVKEQGGEVRVLSSMHESGKRLEGLGGIAAILTYPIEDLDEEVDGGEVIEDDIDELRNGEDVNGIEGRREMDDDIDL